MGIFPNDAMISRLVGAVLLEQHEHWQLEGRRMYPFRGRDEPETHCNAMVLLAS